MYLPDGLVFYSTEATKARKHWSRVYDQSKELLILYQSLLLFYIQAYFHVDWFEFVRHNPSRTWTPIEVLDEAWFQRYVLKHYGAKDDLFNTISRLRKWFRQAPKDSEDRETFCTLMISLIDNFPVTSLREKLPRPLTGPARRLIKIKPDYYSTEMHLNLRGSDLKSSMEKYHKYSAKEIARINSMTESDLWHERLRQVDIPDDVDIFDPWYQAIFLEGQNAKPHRDRVMRDMALVRALNPRRKKGLKRQWKVKWEEDGGTVASEEENEPVGDQGMIQRDRDDSSWRLTRTIGINLAATDDSHSSSSSSSSDSSSRKRRPAEDVVGPSQPMIGASMTSRLQRKQAKRNE